MKKINILVVGLFMSLVGFSAYGIEMNEKQKDYMEDKAEEVVCLAYVLEKSCGRGQSIEADIAPMDDFINECKKEVEGMFQWDDDDDDEGFGDVLARYVKQYVSVGAEKVCDWYVGELKGAKDNKYETALARLKKLAAKFERLAEES